MRSCVGYLVLLCKSALILAPLQSLEYSQLMIDSPLFTTYMYQNLGSQWGSSVPAFLAAACLPLPFLFYRFGDAIRAHSKYAKEAQLITSVMLEQQSVKQEPSTTQQEDEEAAADDM